MFERKGLSLLLRSVHRQLQLPACLFAGAMVDLRSWGTFLEAPTKTISRTDDIALRDPVTAVLAAAVLARKYEASLRS